MTIKQVQEAFYSIAGVDFVEFEVENRLIRLSVGVTGGLFETVCQCQEDLNEFLDIVEVHQTSSICDKKRRLPVKFISDTF